MTKTHRRAQAQSSLYPSAADSGTAEGGAVSQHESSLQGRLPQSPAAGTDSQAAARRTHDLLFTGPPRNPS